MEPARLERVEERIAWLERHVVEQDKAVLELADEVQRLKRELASLRDRVAEPERSASPTPVEERPPHY
jgi:SlyX protein